MRFTILAVAAAVPAVPGSAHDNEAALMAYLDSEIRSWCQSEEIVAAILRRNAEHAGIDRTRLRELDSAWQAEIGAAETPTISPVIEGPTADFLRARVEAAGPISATRCARRSAATAARCRACAPTIWPPPRCAR
jgi:hypothetical protein